MTTCRTEFVDGDKFSPDNVQVNTIVKIEEQVICVTTHFNDTYCISWPPWNLAQNGLRLLKHER